MSVIGSTNERWSSAVRTSLQPTSQLRGVWRPSEIEALSTDSIEVWQGRRWKRIRNEVAGAVDRLKTSADPAVAIVVGGGSILLGDDLPGVGEMIRPAHFEVANAIGAAIAQVGGEVDRVFSLDDIRREEALEVARSEAVDRAIRAGADPATVEVVDVEEVPLAYLPSNAVRIRMKAVGDLAKSA